MKTQALASGQPTMGFSGTIGPDAISGSRSGRATRRRDRTGCASVSPVIVTSPLRSSASRPSDEESSSQRRRSRAPAFVRKESRAAPLPALRSRPLRERSSHAACGPWAARLGWSDSDASRVLTTAPSSSRGARVLADATRTRLSKRISPRRSPLLRLTEHGPRSPFATTMRFSFPLTSASAGLCRRRELPTRQLLLVRSESGAKLRRTSASAARTGPPGVPVDARSPRQITGRVLSDTRSRGRRERLPHVGGVPARGSLPYAASAWRGGQPVLGVV